MDKLIGAKYKLVTKVRLLNSIPRRVIAYKNKKKVNGEAVAYDEKYTENLFLKCKSFLWIICQSGDYGEQRGHTITSITSENIHLNKIHP